MGMRSIRAVALIATLALGLTACASGSSGGGTSPSTIAGLHANDHGTLDVAGKSSVQIKANSYYFEPSVLKGTPGQQLTLHVVNDSGTVHNLTVSAQRVNDDIQSNNSVDAMVTMPSSGVLSFWCAYHKSQGMVGGLLVSGSASDVPAGGATPASSSGSGGGNGGGYGGYGGGGG
jgi:plastocyanin